MKMRKGGNFGRLLVKITKFGTHSSNLSAVAMTAARRRNCNAGGLSFARWKVVRSGPRRNRRKARPRILQQKNDESARRGGRQADDFN